MTKSGVEYNPDASPFIKKINYGDREIIFVFSSSAVMTRFEELLDANREEIRSSLEGRFKIKFNISPEFCDLILYRKQERRFYRVYIDGECVQWQGKLLFDGRQALKVI